MPKTQDPVDLKGYVVDLKTGQEYAPGEVASTGRTLQPIPEGYEHIVMAMNNPARKKWFADFNKLRKAGANTATAARGAFQELEAWR